MARTTILIDDALLRQIKQRAVRNGKTLTAEVNALLRQALQRNQTGRAAHRGVRAALSLGKSRKPAHPMGYGKSDSTLATPPRVGYRLKLPTWSSEQNPGVDLFDRNSLFEWMEKG